MRRILAVGCCALYLAFGFVAGAAHLHASGDQHAPSRGLHLDHTHLGGSTAHGHEHHRGPDSPDDGNARCELGRAGSPGGDVLYLNATAARSSDAYVRLMPATVDAGATIEPPSAMSNRDEALRRQPRDPPRESRTRPRAPPA